LLSELPLAARDLIIQMNNAGHLEWKNKGGFLKTRSRAGWESLGLRLRLAIL
jgi:hypothetical protein